MTALVLDFAAVGPDDLAVVGGKGANLGALTAAGLPVPPGFCVTTAAFAAFVAGPGLDAVFAALDAVAVGDVAAARAAGEQVRAALLERPIPDDVRAAVVSAWTESGTAHAYAVRSSATAEDLPDASFAGQQDTFLNVIGEASLLEHTRRCWASLYTDRAILYRLENGIPHREVALSVVVQRMVRPDKSGILFTADPLTGHRHVTSIDAGFGLGEALVSGLVSADLYRVDRRSNTVIEARPGDKRIAILPAEGDGGGTRTVELDDARRAERVLSDAEALALSAMGARIQERQGCPQDIEWCIEDGTIYIVQARPITSLYPIPAPMYAAGERHASDAPDPGALEVSFCFNHMQVMTDAMPPMTCAVLQRMIPLGKHPTQIGALKPGPWVRVAAGRLFVDLGRVLRRPRLRTAALFMLNAIDSLAAAALREVSSRPGFRAGPKVRRWSVLRFVLPKFITVQKHLWFKDTSTIAARRERWLDELIAGIKARIGAQPDPSARLRCASDELVRLFPKLFELPPILLSGVLASGILRRLLPGAAGTGEIEAVGRALPHNITTYMDLDVGDLADLARPHPPLVAALRDGALTREALAEVEGGPAFLAGLDGFLDRYGARAPSEIDLSRPRWRDDPASVLAAVAGNLARTDQALGAHRAHHEALAREAVTAGEQLVTRARGERFGWLRARLVRRLVRVLRDLAGLREHPKFALIRTLDLIRREVLACGDALGAAGVFETREDAWFLDLEELVAAARPDARPDKSELRALIATRRLAHARDQKLYPPRVITSDGEIPAVRVDRSGIPDGALAGSAASSGVVEGVARVITDPRAEVLHRGEILVAPFTDPGWTPLFINAAGLVMEVGGLMTHGSVVAREYGIPAVVCVPDATRTIRTGDRVRVNGDAGYVEILSHDSEPAPE